MSQPQKKTILVPMDFAQCSMDLIHQAVESASGDDQEVVLLYVAQLPAGVSARTRMADSDGGHPPAGTVLERDGLARLEPYVQVLTSRGITARAMVALGQPAEQILAAATMVGASSILMATHGRKGLSRLLLGSVAEDVSRQAEIPVATLRTRHKPSCDARSCAWCAIARSPAQQRVLAEADG